MKRLLFLFAISLIFAGCSKDSLRGSSDIRIHRIHANGQLQEEYTYNSSGLLQNKVTYGFPGRKTSEITLHYDGHGKLEKRETALDFSSGPNPVWSYGSTNYSYDNNGRVAEEKNYLRQNNTDILTSRIIPTYNAAGQMISRTTYLPNGALNRVTTFQYNGGNIVLQEEFVYNGSTPELHFKYTYDAFDNKRNPYIGLMSAAPPYSLNMNNILHMTVTNYVMNPGSAAVNTSNSVYSTYNSSGLPTKVIENGTTFTIEYR